MTDADPGMRSPKSLAEDVEYQTAMNSVDESETRAEHVVCHIPTGTYWRTYYALYGDWSDYDKATPWYQVRPSSDSTSKYIPIAPTEEIPPTSCCSCGGH